MTSLPVLALPDFTKPFILEPDASGQGLGAMLMQDHWPIAFFSHRLSTKARQKLVYERELIAIVFVVQKLCHYLLGSKFTVRTNQRSLKCLLEQRLINPDCQKWMTKVLGFNFDIQYRPSLENKAVDALSRIPYVADSSLSCGHLDQLANQVQQHPKLQSIISDLLVDPTSHPGYSLLHNHLLNKTGWSFPPNLHSLL